MRVNADKFRLFKQNHLDKVFFSTKLSKMDGRAVSCDSSSLKMVREVKLEEDEEEFRSCCEDDEVWRETEEVVKEEPKYLLGESSVKLFFKGISINEVGDCAIGLSGIGVSMERLADLPSIQVQKKLDFFVDESVADYLALMDGLVEASQNNIRHVYAFTDSKMLHDQVSLSIKRMYLLIFDIIFVSS